MIKIDTDELLKLKHYILVGKSNSVNSSSSVDEEDNATALSMSDAYKILPSDPDELVKLFKLNDPNNKYILLKLLSRGNLEGLTFNLDKDSMLLVMKFFSTDKLMMLISNLPKYRIVDMLKKVFTDQQILKLMPEKFMDQFLTNDQLDKQDLLKSLETLPPEALSKMIEAVTGKPSQNLNSSQSKQEQSKNMVSELSGMNPTKFKKALVSMEKDDKIKVISNLTTKDKKNWDLFPKEALTASFSAAPKELILKGMEALKEDELGKIINNLPNELLTQSLTLLKPEVFAEQLLQKNSDLLARVLTSAA